MVSNGLTSAGGSYAIIKCSPKDKPVAEDWPALYAHIQASGEFELLHKRLTQTAVEERWEDGVQVPGVINLPGHKLTIGKAPT